MDVWRDPWADEEAANEDEKKGQEEREEQQWESRPSALSPGTSAWKGLDLPTSPGWSRVTGSNGLGWSAPPSPGFVSEKRNADDAEDHGDGEDNIDSGEIEDTRRLELQEIGPESLHNPTPILQDSDAKPFANGKADLGTSFQNAESEASSESDQTSESAHATESDDASHQDLPSVAPTIDDRAAHSSHGQLQDTGIGADTYKAGQDDVHPANLDSAQSSKSPARQVSEAERTLLGVMFPRLSKELPENSSLLKEPPEELIGRSNTRRTWYRISRPDPMREVERGETDENYVRVAWPTSKIRDKTLQIVGRWTAEQRLRGRLFVDSPAAAPFAWSDNTAGADSSSPVLVSESSQPPAAQARKVSTAQAPRAEAKSPFASPAMVQFSWSTQIAEPPVATSSALFSPNLLVVEGAGIPDRELIESPKFQTELGDSIMNGSDYEVTKVKKWEVQLPPVSLSKPLSPTTINKRALSDARQYQEATSTLDAKLVSEDSSAVPSDSMPRAILEDSIEPQLQSSAKGEPPRMAESDWGDFFSMQEAKAIPDAQAFAAPIIHNAGVFSAAVAPSSGLVGDDDDEFEWGEMAQPTANVTSMTEASDFVWAEPQFGVPSNREALDIGFNWSNDISSVQASVVHDLGTQTDHIPYAESPAIRGGKSKIPLTSASLDVVVTSPQLDASLSMATSPVKTATAMPLVPRRRSSLEWMKATAGAKPLAADERSTKHSDTLLKELLDTLPNFEYMLN